MSGTGAPPAYSEVVFDRENNKVYDGPKVEAVFPSAAKNVTPMPTGVYGGTSIQNPHTKLSGAYEPGHTHTVPFNATGKTLSDIF